MADQTYGLNHTLTEPTSTKQLDERTEEEGRWQQRLLPLMAGMIIALSIFFFLVTFGQLIFLQQNILRSPPIEISSTLDEALNSSDLEFEELYRLRQFEVQTAMERYTTEKRYHHAGVLMMSALWLRYLGFVTGMILALIGATFILGKLREPEQEMEGRFSQISMSLRTTSPGIILAVLGVILMFATLVDKDDFDVTDGNIYLPEPAKTSEIIPDGGASGDIITLPDIPAVDESDLLPGPP